MPVVRWSPRALDAVGGSLLVALAAWAAVVGGRNDGRPGPVLVLLGALGAAVAVGRVLDDRGVAVAGPVAAAILAAIALTYPGLGQAGGAPMGYANANATLAAVGALAATAAARTARPGRDRLAWVGVAIVLASATIATRSTAGIVCLAVAATLLGVCVARRRGTAVALGGMVLSVLALGITFAAAVDPDPALRPTDTVRIDLWSAAADLSREEPITGLGVGAFEVRNPVTDDADLRWVHHEHLEVAVELGAVGLGLLLALQLWVFVRLSIDGSPVLPPTVAAIGVVLAVHGTVDHVWHRPVPLLLAAVLFGAATGCVAPTLPVPPPLDRQRSGWVLRTIDGNGAEA